MTTMRAAVYARYSSDLQRQTSIDDQVAVTRRYAAQHDWTLPPERIYTDAGISGASLEGRPGIQALLQAASGAPRPFDVVLVDDSSRVARDLRDALHVVRMLKFFGVRTVYISQQIDSDNEQAETLLTVHGLVDGLYLQELSKKTKRGIQGQQGRGFSTGGKTYGYRSVPEFDPAGKRDSDGPVIIGKRLEVDPVQAEVIRQVFRWYADGVSHPKMADRLNAMDVPTPRGSRWTKHHTDRMLRNERYRGQAIWGQVIFERRPGTNQRVARRQPRHAWHVEDRPELRIIDDDLWYRAQARRNTVRASLNLTAGRVRGRSGLYSKHLLVGLSRCGVCGKAFTIAGTGHGSPRYGCPNSWHNGTDTCDNRLTVMAKVTDPLVLQVLTEQLLRPRMVKTITKAVTAEIKLALATSPSERKRLEAKRNTVGKKLANLVEAIEHGINMPSLTEQIAKREAELRAIDDDLAELAHPPDVDIAVIPTWVRQQLKDLSGLLAENPQRAKAELQRLNVRFTVTPVRDEGKPFLRVEGTGDLDALCGIRNLPSTARSKALTTPSPPLYREAVSIGSRSRPRSARGNEPIAGAHRARDGALGEQSDWSSICPLADPDRGLGLIQFRRRFS